MLKLTKTNYNICLFQFSLRYLDGTKSVFPLNYFQTKQFFYRKKIRSELEPVVLFKYPTD